MNTYRKSDIPDDLQKYFEPAELGLEETPEEYVTNVVEVFAEVRRMLKEDGTCWLNLGDSYAGGGRGDRSHHGYSDGRANRDERLGGRKVPGLKPKDLCGIPWRVALALQADGWWLRQDIIWCLSGGVKVYAKTQKGEMPTTLKDLYRLDPSTVQLWNGQRWTQLLGMNRSQRHGDELEIELRSGEKIGCTPAHQWPTQRGLVATSELRVGDVIDTCGIPAPPGRDIEPGRLNGWDIGRFVGLYIAEGSRDSTGTIQIASHIHETDRYHTCKGLAEQFDGTCRWHKTSQNGMTICIDSKVLSAVIDMYVSGRTSHGKHLSPKCWARDNSFLKAVLVGYLQGDGHYDMPNRRWRLGFCRNDSLASDLRTVCARLGCHITLRTAWATMNGRRFPAYRGEIRYTVSGHHNVKPKGEIVKIGKSRCRYVYDVGVADDPHLFALASGVLTHNSKPNPMPESVTDRCTKAHEYVFLLTKAARYYFDAQAIAEECASEPRTRYRANGVSTEDQGHRRGNGNVTSDCGAGNTRNRRSVWTIATRGFSGAHFATFPPELPELCIKAGCPAAGVVLDPFMGAGTVAMVAAGLDRRYIGIELNPEYAAMARKRVHGPLFTEEQ